MYEDLSAYPKIIFSISIINFCVSKQSSSLLSVMVKHEEADRPGPMFDAEFRTENTDQRLLGSFVSA